eukprot:Rmarinus@m.28662
MSDLFVLKNNFYIGDYISAVNEGSSLQLDDEGTQLKRDIYIQKSQLAQGNYQLVVNSIAEDSAATELVALKYLAVYLAGRASYDDVLERVRSLIKLPECQLVEAVLHTCEGKYEEALGVLHSCSDLDALGLRVYVLLRMDRANLAAKELQTMQAADPDSTLTQLAEAWIALRLGGEKVRDASNIFDELSQRFGETVLLMNGLAACHIASGDYAAAEAVLQNAMRRNPNDPDTLANLACVAPHCGKSADQITQLVTQLRTCAPTHHLPKALDVLSANFDTAAQQFA